MNHEDTKTTTHFLFSSLEIFLRVLGAFVVMKWLLKVFGRSRMKWVVLLILAFVMSSSPRLWAQDVFGDAPIRFILPSRLDPGSCQFLHRLVGPFGAVGGLTRPKPNASEFEVATVYKVIPGESVKVVLYCSGGQLQTATFDSLPALAGRTVQLNPKQLGTVQFVGMVRGLSSPTAQVLWVDVDYMPRWICEFFSLAECGLGGWNVASVELDKEGKFSAIFPDFVRDVAIGSFKNPGDFGFRIRDQKTGKLRFELRAPVTAAPFERVRAANRNPGTQIFDAIAK
jgi:hypothetical protein